MNTSREDKKRIKSKAIRLNEALKIIDQEYDDKQIISIIKERDGKIKLSPGYFSKYKRADKYIAQINEHTLDKIVKILDSFLKENYGMKWNENVSNYEKQITLGEQNLPKEIKVKVSDDAKLDQLKGIWKGFAWNKKRSYEKKAGHIYISKMKIIDRNSVIYITRWGNFQGRIGLVGNNKIAIELVATDRKMYLLGKIGVSDNLKNREAITLAYIDSGNEDIKCGLTVIKRTLESFDQIIPKSYPIHEFEEGSNIVELLKDTQIITKMFES